MDPSLWHEPPQPPVVETTIEDDESAGPVVLTVVGAVAGVALVDLPPLYDHVDPDALDALFTTGATCGNVVFRYDGFVVVVTADERVEVYDEEPAS